MRADDNEELHSILRDFLEPDTSDKKINGGAVIRTVIYSLEFKTKILNKTHTIFSQGIDIFTYAQTA